MARSFVVVFAPEAGSEVTTITVWWSEHRPAAPRLFQLELRQALLKVAAHPELGVRTRLRGAPGARAVTLQRTGYVVFYDVKPDEAEIQVLRVRHGKRRPLSRVKRR